jgi:hypothetical protein
MSPPLLAGVELIELKIIPEPAETIIPATAKESGDQRGSSFLVAACLAKA